MSEIEEWAARLELSRRGLDLRLDAEGRWYHEGIAFEHRRLIELFDRGLDLHPETGEPILRVGDRWCYIRADDVPFVVRALHLEGATLVARLNTGEHVALARDALELRGEHLYARLDDRRVARLDRATHKGLATMLSEDRDGEPSVAGEWRITTRT